MKLGSQLFVRLFKQINLGFRLAYSLEQGAVSLFTSKEFTDHFLDISHLGGSLDILEGLINLGGVAHFLLHAFTHVSVP